MAHVPDAGASPFSEADRCLVRHRVLTECARHGVSLDEFEVGGRHVPVPELLERLISTEPPTNELMDQVRLSTAWCRLHGMDGLARLVDVVADVRQRFEAGQPADSCMPRLWRFIELRTGADLVSPTTQMTDFIRVHVGIHGGAAGRRDRAARHTVG